MTRVLPVVAAPVARVRASSWSRSTSMRRAPLRASYSGSLLLGTVYDCAISSSVSSFSRVRRWGLDFGLCVHLPAARDELRSGCVQAPAGRAARVAVMGRRAGSSSRQRSSASGHLGLNGQSARRRPLRSSDCAAGPGAGSRWLRGATCCRGCRGPGPRRRAAACTDGRLLGDFLGRARAPRSQPAYMTSTSSAKYRSRGDVVGDVQHGQAEALAQVVAAGSASRAGSRRPAWTPARRPAARSGGRPAPGRTDPLALAAGQLVRVLDQEVTGAG